MNDSELNCAIELGEINEVEEIVARFKNLPEYGTPRAALRLAESIAAVRIQEAALASAINCRPSQSGSPRSIT